MCFCFKYLALGSSWFCHVCFKVNPANQVVFSLFSHHVHNPRKCSHDFQTPFIISSFTTCNPFILQSKCSYSSVTPSGFICDKMRINNLLYTEYTSPVWTLESIPYYHKLQFFQVSKPYLDVYHNRLLLVSTVYKDPCTADVCLNFQLLYYYQQHAHDLPLVC